jgi:hypothetical protein
MSEGYFTTRSRLMKPSRSRAAFMMITLAAFAVTELGRFVYRPYVNEHSIDDLGLADSIGNLGGIVVQIFLGLAVLNPNRRQGYRLARLFAAGYVLYEFAQPYLPKGVFDWKDVYATVIGWLISLFLMSVVWYKVGPGDIPETRNGSGHGPNT